MSVDPRIQHIMDFAHAKSTADASERGVLTLGALIDALGLLPADTPVVLKGAYPGAPDSYRGYYERAAFPLVEDAINAGELHKRLTERLGTWMTGWKGGDYQISRGTLLHAAERGDLGDEIYGVALVEGVCVLQTRAEEW
jgi:hypothetical protein